MSPDQLGKDVALGLVEAFVRASPWSVAVFDRTMRYLAHNDDWVAVHGYADRRELVGRSHYDVFPEISAEWREIHARCLAGVTERCDRDEFVRRDGGREYLRWIVTPWRTNDGAIHGIVIFAENITRQVLTQRKLEEREALIGGFFAQSPVGLNLCRMDGLWLESNPAFLDIIGYSREEADGGLTYWQLTPRSYDADEARQLESLRTTGRYGPYEKEFIRKDSSRVPVRLNGFLVERDGETYIWSLIEDLTEQRLLERRVEQERVKAIQSAKLATLGEMAAGIAHEINNPLQIIELYTHLLTTAVEASDRAAIAEAVDAIRGATARAATIVTGLKKFAREAPDQTEHVQLAKLVEETLTLWRTRVHSHTIELATSLDSEAWVVARRIEIGQVLVNLLNNALDAVRHATHKWIRLAVAVEGSWVVVSVEDSGPPVSDEVAAEMFRAFFTTKAESEGTGLGLSISREIIERYAGTLDLDRTSANTRFVIRLRRYGG